MRYASLSALALCAGAALLLAPATELRAFSKLGGSLGETQRDVRVFDNFADPEADDNASFAAQFPGWNGLELAVWKAIAEWGSRPHGDGSGDPLDDAIGSGGGNFDAFWAGAASGIGGNNDNIVSALANCGGSGTLGFCETPISDGWRIRFCDEWLWDDGPAEVGGAFDLQGLLVHQYGHALGLGHSAVPTATMAPSAAPGSTSLRSLDADDSSGVRCVYGVASATKPVIVATVADAEAGTLAIHGQFFALLDNEVWFCPSTVTSTDADPIVRVTGVGASRRGTLVTVTIPAGASAGDVLVNKPGIGGSTLSNAFPTDLLGTFGVPPVQRAELASVLPATIDALVPGTAQTVKLSGSRLDLATAVTVDGAPLPASRWTLVDEETITLDMPQVATLGAHHVGVTDGVVLDELAVTVVAPAAPTLAWGNGDANNAVSVPDGLDFVVAGPVGETHLVLSSNVGPPELGAFFGLASRFDGGPQLVAPGAYEIPTSGWLAVHIPALPDPSLAGSTWHARSFAIVRPAPFAGSNDQSITLVP